MAAPPKSQVEAIALRLRVARAALDISQAELCRRTGIAPNTYNQWEKAKGAPDIWQAILLAKALGYTLDYIYRGDESGLPIRIAGNLKA